MEFCVGYKECYTVTNYVHCGYLNYLRLKQIYKSDNFMQLVKKVIPDANAHTILIYTLEQKHESKSCRELKKKQKHIWIHWSNVNLNDKTRGLESRR